MAAKPIFGKEWLEKCMEKIKDNRWIMRDILAIFREELNSLLLPYVCVLGVYIVWLLVLMICNTFLLWSIRSNYLIITSNYLALTSNNLAITN